MLPDSFYPLPASAGEAALKSLCQSLCHILHPGHRLGGTRDGNIQPYSLWNLSTRVQYSLPKAYIIHLNLRLHRAVQDCLYLLPDIKNL